MKKWAWVFILFVLAGCETFESRDIVKEYIDEPKYLIKDKSYENHQERLDVLETKYLNEEISYTEYQQMKQRVEEGYTMEVQKRDAILSSQE